MTTSKFLRSNDLDFIFRTLAEGYSSSVVGLSNTGKSMLLRTVCRIDVQRHLLGKRASEFFFIYVDCNLMLTLAPQGFYEVTLRAAQDVLESIQAPDSVVGQLGDLYRKVIEPPSEFAGPLAFHDAIDVLSRDPDPHLVFLLDEFDGGV